MYMLVRVILTTRHLAIGGDREYFRDPARIRRSIYCHSSVDRYNTDRRGPRGSAGDTETRDDR